MAKELFDIEKVEKQGDKYVYEHHLKVEMTQEEYDEHIKFLNRNLKTLKDLIVKFDPEKEVNKQLEQMRNQLAIQKEALKDWDKYVAEQQEAFLDKIKNAKEDVEKSVANHLLNRDKVLEKVREIGKKRLEPIESQLVHDKKKLKVYTDVQSSKTEE